MISFLFSCENATCTVPEAYRELFRGAEEIVASTDGWEPGSLSLAQAFSMRFRTPLVYGDVTRLLIDLEKGGDARWSRFSMKLPESMRSKLVERQERIYRRQLAQRIAEGLRKFPAVLHVFVHTSPTNDGRVLLETPGDVAAAKALAEAWRGHLTRADLSVSYVSGAGPNDLEAHLAREFAGTGYHQVRLTVSQSFFLEGKPWRWETVKKVMQDTLNLAAGEAAVVSAPESRATDQA